MKRLINKNFGKLKILDITKIKREYFCLCLCSCGNKKLIRKYNVINNKTKSCGCFHIETIKRTNSTHGMSRVNQRSSFYRMWESLKQRCNNRKVKMYPRYGGRGISYDPRWEEFLEFKKDMYFKYLYAIKQKYKYKITKKNMITLERVDVNGNYCKENCKFIPKSEQANNTKHNKWFIATSPEGKKYKSKNQSGFAKENNLTHSLINKVLQKKRRHHKNWYFEYI